MGAEIVPPLIAAQLNYLLSQSPLPIKVERMWSGSKNHSLLDRFTLLIPFCLDYIKWDIIYNGQYPLAAPDVIFGADDENFHPFLIGENDRSSKNSLCDWNSKDPSRLLSLIHQLREYYMAYQRKRVGEVDDERLKFEVSTILHREFMKPDDEYVKKLEAGSWKLVPGTDNDGPSCVVSSIGMEMSKSSGLEKADEVVFAVPLMEMDINKMVVGCPWRHQQKIYLQVVFPVGKKYLSAPSAPRLKLVSSSELKSLFSIEDVKLPPWLNGMCMAEYIPRLEKTLEEQVLEAVGSIDDRRRFIEALAPLLGRPVEADPIFCRKATFLAASGVFTYLVHFFLSTQYPKHQPALMLQSSQHFNSQGAPVKSLPLKDFPWSPRWEVSQMAEKIFEFLVDESSSFKKYCNEGHLQQH